MGVLKRVVRNLILASMVGLFGACASTSEPSGERQYDRNPGSDGWEPVGFRSNA